MAASIKVSELQEILSLTSDDLFLVTDLGSGSSRKVSYATLISGLEAQIGTSQATLQAAIDAVQFDVDQNELASDTAIAHEASNRTAAITTLRSLIDALQADVDQNEADADAAIAAETSARTLAVTGETTAREQAVAALQALIDGLQTEASSRLTRIETLETSLDNLDIDISPETLNSINELAAALGNDADFVTTINDAIAALQADVDQNESDADAADAALSARLDVLETDPTTAAALAAAVAAVQVDVDQNEADADAAIAALQSTIDALDIDIAPETLNSIDELAAAMGDDPTFLTTLQNRVTVIENDNATQTELNDYIAHIEARNLEAGLATGVLYADTIYGG